jgi:phosphopantothenoylcysteine decarboxylase / phosphopantothenate---cysteine ligase
VTEVLDGRAFPLRGKRVVVGIAGGIAAYKAAELVRGLVKAGADVHCVMTAGAKEFITPLTFQTLSGHPVGTELFDLGQESEIGHIKIADKAELVIVAPATADLIARYAAGMANDLLSTVLLATRATVLLAPAMNVNMWDHPITQANLARLVGTGRVQVVGPGEGFLACRWTGPGRLAEPADIVEVAGRLLLPQDLAGKKILVTAGPTREALDPVRFLSNRSSGKMGYAVARAAAARGAEVVLVAGPTSLAAPLGVTVVPVGSAQEMKDAVAVEIVGADVVVMAAAVADYRAGQVAAGKLKKEDMGASPSIGLARNPDVLAELGKARGGGGPRPVLVGFAAETDDVERRARAKLVTKGCDLVVANDVSEAEAGFDVDTNRVMVVGPGDAVERLPLATKDEVAHRIWDRVKPLLPG